jgi:hypothetical protein
VVYSAVGRPLGHSKGTDTRIQNTRVRTVFRPQDNAANFISTEVDHLGTKFSPLCSCFCVTKDLPWCTGNIKLSLYLIN